MKREHASVVLVFGGFVVLVLVFRGVWGNAWHALIGRKSSSSSGAAAPASSTSSAGATRAVFLQPGSFGIEYPTPAAGAIAGQGPRPSGGGSSSSGGLEFPFTPAGFSQSQVAAAAARYAQGRSYGGAPYVPHMIVQEGHIETRNGRRGTYIKFSTGAGESTEWVPLE